MKHRLYHFAAGLALTLGALLSAGCGHESVASPGAQPATVSLPAATATESPAGPVEPVAGEVAPSEIAAHAAEPPAGAPKPESPENDAEPPRTKGQRPPADRTPTKPGEAEKITWDDLNLGMPADVVFRPFMISDRAKELEGKKISILGFIHGAAAGGSKAKIKELILLKNTECKYGPQGQADHLAAVYFAEGKAASFTDKAIKVEGTLTIEPVTGKDGNTWSVFRLEDAVVK
jgi:hypothetical protein